MKSRTWIAVGAGVGLLLWLNRSGRQPETSRSRPSRAAWRGAAFAPDEPRPAYGGSGGSRNAGPESMRSGREQQWDEVAEASDESFPASDPPAYLPATI